ncbi:mitochondrial ribosome-associated GTPase 1 isoform X3 [Mauremys mutica]|uniref:mitochondrial ribosome-associated GTPase 1 isoform X3 n=1 Tax=Mauremys mutica TaxID=74926 RepID=UPI001D16C0A1|nr:mitochondrial ribosome-associated GTPase 1 isoform X3 [Mauremys mutica]
MLPGAGCAASGGPGLRQMKESLRKVDCLIEVHDARIPFSGRNPAFQESLGIRPHLLVLNKMDLADLTHKAKILERLEQEGLKNILFTNCVKDENVKKVIPLITDLVSNSQRYQRVENMEYCIMVIGVPNVGKSSLINSMRRLHLKKGKASRVGGEPGITKAVLTRIQVSERPLMYLLDTPGVLAPRIESVEAGMKLALCGAIRDHLVGEGIMADYLLYTLNKQQQFRLPPGKGRYQPCCPMPEQRGVHCLRPPVASSPRRVAAGDTTQLRGALWAGRAQRRHRERAQAGGTETGQDTQSEGAHRDRGRERDRA